MVPDMVASLDGWSSCRSCAVNLVNTELSDDGESIAEALAHNPAVAIVGTAGEQISHLKEDLCTAVSLRNGGLSQPNGGVSLGIEPSIQSTDTLVAIYAKVKVKFPPEMQWNKGGNLLGVYGTYCNNFSSPARALSAFESRLRWDARGKLSLYTRPMNDDPNEWQSRVDTRTALERDVWYELALAVHVDGRVVASADGNLVYDSTCSIGLEELKGIKFSVMCLDNSEIEDLYIHVKGLSISADIDSGHG